MKQVLQDQICLANNRCVIVTHPVLTAVFHSYYVPMWLPVSSNTWHPSEILQ